MEKALHRQRILLQHLQPSSSQTSDSPAISVSSRRSYFLIFITLCIIFICLFSFSFFGFLLSSKASICSAGEAAGYHRKPAFDDDVVIVA